MKTIQDLLVLGDDRLYTICDPVLDSDWEFLPYWIKELDSVMNEFRSKYHFGRAIAAPQIGVMKRLIYMNLGQPLVFVNPEIIRKSEQMFEVWDDCMSFPLLYVKVKRHFSIKVQYLNENGEKKEWEMENDLSELFQHEYDHLDGILCTMRAIDNKSYKWRTL